MSHISLRPRTRLRRRAAMAGLMILAASVSAAAARANDNDTIQNMFRAGAVYGQVVDTKTGKPVSDATVALQDRRGRIIAWTRTDDEGQYRLAANSLAALDLEEHHRGMIDSLGRGFVEVIKLPIDMAGVAVGAATNTVVGAVKAIDPIGTIKAAAVSAAEGNPMTLAQQAATDMSNLISGQSQQTVRGNAASAILYPTAKPKPKAPVGPQPGEATILVSAPQYQEFRGAAGSYYMAPATNASADPATQTSAPTGTRAWLDTVQLAPQSDPKAISATRDQAAILTNAMVTPAFAAAGAPMKISVQLQTPATPDVQVRVIARIEKTHQVVELLSDGNGTYTGTLWLDPNTPLGDTTLTIAALTAAPVNVDLAPATSGDAMLTYASNLDDLDAGRPYHFDPRITASENRIDVKMTVLNPALETPTASTGN